MTPDETYQAILAKGGSYEKLVMALSKEPMTEAEASHVLWELTPFPMVSGPAITPYIVEALNG